MAQRSVKRKRILLVSLLRKRRERKRRRRRRRVRMSRKILLFSYLKWII